MVRWISRKVANDCADKVIVKMFGFRVGAYDMVDAGRELALIELPCRTFMIRWDGFIME
jgi:hypothetical protein